MTNEPSHDFDESVTVPAGYFTQREQRYQQSEGGNSERLEHTRNIAQLVYDTVSNRDLMEQAERELAGEAPIITRKHIEKIKKDGDLEPEETVLGVYMGSSGFPQILERAIALSKKQVWYTPGVSMREWTDAVFDSYLSAVAEYNSAKTAEEKETADWTRKKEHDTIAEVLVRDIARVFEEHGEPLWVGDRSMAGQPLPKRSAENLDWIQSQLIENVGRPLVRMLTDSEPALTVVANKQSQRRQ